MEAVSPCSVADALREASPVAPVAKKPVAGDSTAAVEEAGQSTVCCSSEDEYPSSGAYPSDDERQDSDAQPQPQPQQQQQQPSVKQHSPPPVPQLTLPQQQLPRPPSEVPPIQTAPYAYTISSLQDVTVEQPPTSWLKPRIKIDGPEIFHGLLRANDENLPAHETVPSTETFVAFQGQWRVVTSAGTSSYIGATMNPWDPSTATYPLPITYKVAQDAVVVRETVPSSSRANARLGVLERVRRFFCTSIAEYMQS
ncbi:hypothetical protein, conserved [Eimeria tenella]|uniref:Uncharacterized protein n=1 Tax=Eimeria tenella TaxID=5802 RepID=U6L670_EIMTE|nr:hypothetical protein, conserved [Eimeria tenella]CDJ43295.1 hypothetical protein, conserved [Eimeria tenella]|eukprot:XP_013234045.1 hypothetical protein, conserved [Eimeria tenella]